jgi:hypothetical protein
MTDNGQVVARSDWAKGGTTTEYDAANHDWLKHRDAAAYENDLAMLREMGRGFNEPELNNSSPRFGAGSRLWKIAAFRSRKIIFAPQARRSWRDDNYCASLGLTAAVRNGAGWRDAARRHVRLLPFHLGQSACRADSKDLVD